MKSYEWIGWLSSFILLVTIAKQIQKQWKTHSVKAVSRYLFWGQVGAELGFVIYSYLLRNWVFFAVNFALLIENLVGLGVTLLIQKETPKPSIKRVALLKPLNRPL